MSELYLKLLSTQLSHLDITGTYSFTDNFGDVFHYLTYRFNNFDFCVRIEDHLFECEKISDCVIILQNILLNDMVLVQYLFFNDSTYKQEVNTDYQALCSKIHDCILFFELLNCTNDQDRFSFEVIEDFISKLFFEKSDWLDIYQKSLTHFKIDLSDLPNSSIISLIAKNV